MQITLKHIYALIAISVGISRGAAFRTPVFVRSPMSKGLSITSPKCGVSSSTVLFESKKCSGSNGRDSRLRVDKNVNNHEGTNNKKRNLIRRLFSPRNAAVAAAVSALALVPTVGNAFDFAMIPSSAMNLAASTNAFMAKFSETGFYQAFSLVFLSEIGDKTFFIAGLLAMKTSRFLSFVGSVSALAVMTIISVLIGQIFHAVPSGFTDGIPLDDIAAVLAFTFFGVKTLMEALDMEAGASAMDEELAEAEEAVKDSDTGMQSTAVARILSIFGLVFAAEFGDRSFLSTIALSAAQNPVSVAVGAIAAHAVATGVAVAGGSIVAKYLSERVIGLIGGSLFIIFAITTALGIF